MERTRRCWLLAVVCYFASDLAVQLLTLPSKRHRLLHLGVLRQSQRPTSCSDPKKRGGSQQSEGDPRDQVSQHQSHHVRGVRHRLRPHFRHPQRGWQNRCLGSERRCISPLRSKQGGLHRRLQAHLRHQCGRYLPHHQGILGARDLRPKSRCQRFFRCGPDRPARQHRLRSKQSSRQPDHPALRSGVRGYRCHLPDFPSWRYPHRIRRDTVW